jgi:hypothetical protein
VRKIPLQQRSVYIPVTGDYANYEKIINGYYPSQDVRYTKVNELRYEFRIPKDPSFNYSLAFSIDIGKI